MLPSLHGKLPAVVSRLVAHLQHQGKYIHIYNRIRLYVTFLFYLFSNFGSFCFFASRYRLLVGGNATLSAKIIRIRP